MADVSSRYHGGDGDDDGRYPDGRPRIDSQCEGSSKLLVFFQICILCIYIFFNLLTSKFNTSM